MMRPNRCFAGATARKPYARALRARASLGARARSARTRGLQAAAPTKHRFNRVVAQRSGHA
eukprot:3679002-Lingulodinium_polyedra.AAC.1